MANLDPRRKDSRRRPTGRDCSTPRLPIIPTEKQEPALDTRLYSLIAGAGVIFVLSCFWARLIVVRVRRNSKPASFIEKLILTPFALFVSVIFFGAAYIEFSTGLQWLPLHGKYSAYEPIVPTSPALYWLGIVFCYFTGVTVSALGVAMLWPRKSD